MLKEQQTAMTLTASPEPATLLRGSDRLRPARVLPFLAGLWFLLFFCGLFAPPVLDDADGTHANAARQMVLSGDWVTLRVNNVRYLEKAPLPYWLVAVSFRVFGFNTFAAHLPEALSVLLLTLLGYTWARSAFGDRAALYTGLGVLTSAGVFLFTRVFIPEVLLSLLLCAALFCFLHALESAGGWAYGFWAALALAVLTKGLVALVFVFGAASLYLAWTRELQRWRRTKPLSGLALLLAIAAPWHILAGLRNTGGMDGHGFFWFYFINEHVLRFLGRRTPMDYNKLPAALYWSLHMIWLFPMSLFLPVALRRLWRERESIFARHSARDFGTRTTLLLSVFAGLVMVFFSLSTNQEYYTFPAYLPLLMLIAWSLAEEERGRASRWITSAHGALTVIGGVVASALAYGLWTSRHLAFVPDIGALLAHRGVGDYTLSMSSLFDLTGPSFAALRLPAALAMITFAVGPGLAWRLRLHGRHIEATSSMALTAAAFLIAAHIALVRFAPMLSSQDFAARIMQLERDRSIEPENILLLYGDQAYGSSLPFYLNRPLDGPALLVDGRSSSMWFGSTFADAQALFLTPEEMLVHWGTGERKLLFVPLEQRDRVERLLGARATVLQETSGKALLTDRPLNSPAEARGSH